MYRVTFIHPTTLQEYTFKNERGFGWTWGANQDGSINISVLRNESSRLIVEGFVIKLYRLNVLRFTGFVMEITKSKNKVSVKAIDLYGFLKYRHVNQQTPVNAEGSVELITHLDGTVLNGGITLSADTFIVPSQTIRDWKWNYQTKRSLSNEIANNVLSVDGNTYGFFLSIAPDGEVIFEPEGAGEIREDLPFNNVSITTDIWDTRNDIIVRGREGFIMPPDKDGWSENTLDAWNVVTGATVVEPILTLDPAVVDFGQQSLKFVIGETGGELDDIYRSIITQENDVVNLEIIQEVHIRVYVTDKTKIDNMKLVFIDSTSNLQITADFQASLSSGAWVTISKSKGDFSGSGDWTDMEAFAIEIDSNDPVTVYMDNIFIDANPISDNSTDVSSIATYGTLEVIVKNPDVLLDADAQARADIIKNYKKDKQVRASVSLQKNVDVRPNQLIPVTDVDDVSYLLPISNAQFFVNQDGSESTSLTLGRKKRGFTEIIDELNEKLVIEQRERNKEAIIKP